MLTKDMVNKVDEYIHINVSFIEVWACNCLKKFGKELRLSGALLSELYIYCMENRDKVYNKYLKKSDDDMRFFINSFFVLQTQHTTTPFYKITSISDINKIQIDSEQSYIFFEIMPKTNSIQDDIINFESAIIKESFVQKNINIIKQAIIQDQILGPIGSLERVIFKLKFIDGLSGDVIEKVLPDHIKLKRYIKRDRIYQIANITKQKVIDYINDYNNKFNN